MSEMYSTRILLESLGSQVLEHAVIFFISMVYKPFAQNKINNLRRILDFFFNCM